MTNGVDLGASCCPGGRLKHRHDRYLRRRPASGTSPRWSAPGRSRGSAAASVPFERTRISPRGPSRRPAAADDGDDVRRLCPPRGRPVGRCRALGRAGRGRAVRSRSSAIDPQAPAHRRRRPGRRADDPAGDLALRDDADDGVRSETLARPIRRVAPTVAGSRRRPASPCRSPPRRRRP